MTGPNENRSAATDGRAIPPESGGSVPEIPFRHVLLLLALLTLAMFGDVLLAGGKVVLSAEGTDGIGQLIHWREFGFRELKAGNLALWNPHCYCGLPFFGSFQSALLYPLNVLFLILPLPVAFNWSFVLHVYLAGVFTWLWVRNRGVHSLAALLAAFIFMFGGPFFLRVFAGHLAHLCVMTWVPLVFLAIDRIIARPTLGGFLLGLTSVTMTILAGNPQYVYYLALAAFLYAVLEFFRLNRSLKVLGCLLAVCLGALGLAAVQLLTGIGEQSEGLRGPGLPYDFASMFSFAPENFLTLIAPYFFGDFNTSPYWGRWYLWEMSLYIGVPGLLFALYGAWVGKGQGRRNILILLGVLIILCLGAYTPLYHALHAWLPGYNKFRGSAKFAFLIQLFLALLAAIGLDHLLKSRQDDRRLVRGSLMAGGVLALLAGIISLTGSSWLRVMQFLESTGQVYTPQAQLETPAFIAQSAAGSGQSLGLAAGGFFMLAVILWRSRQSPRWSYGIVLLAVVELFSVARGSIAIFAYAQRVNPAISNLVRQHPGDYRILNLDNPTSDIAIPAFDVWGEDPGCLSRYGQFLAFTQGQDPNKVTQALPLRQTHPLFSMVRCRFVFDVGKDGAVTATEMKNPLPRLLLMEQCRVLTNRDQIFSAMAAPSFDPRKEVILETSPDPSPKPGGGEGTVKLLENSTDFLSIQADLAAPAILLITDTYSRSWRVIASPGAPQPRYEVLPANYCLRAIPLAAGHHQFRLEYSPRGFRIGKWISLVSLLIYLGLAAVFGMKFFRARKLAGAGL